MSTQRSGTATRKIAKSDLGKGIPAPKQKIKAVGNTRSMRVVLRPFYTLIIVTLLPIIRNLNLWIRLLLGARPRAWDGTGHYAVSQIYSKAIFPDTFGWTGAYFAGMPLPNFYPPLFYWCVALLEHTRIFSHLAAFKILIAAPIILLPAVIWWLTWALTDKDRQAATGAALAIIPLLIDYRLYRPIGLDYLSTFVIGLYTQPLGFVLLVIWLITYLGKHYQRWRLPLSCLLLALTVLANFFNAVTAALFIATTLIVDLIRTIRERDNSQQNETRNELLLHLISPVFALCLTLFWVVPMLSTYENFVTRPHIVPIDEMVAPAIWFWYVLAAAGIFVWICKPTRAMWPFLSACLILAASVIFSSLIAPRWFPLQITRFTTTLNFLLAVPVGRAISSAFQLLATALGEKVLQEKRGYGYNFLWPAPKATGVTLILIVVIFLLIKTPYYSLAFYPTSDREKIDGLLHFGQQHKDGRYLVETPNLSDSEASFDGRALSSYLGSQGNEVVSVVFREASPNALFFNPLVNTFSASPDSFGISSMLADDIAFAEQPLSKHLARARSIGVKYLAIASPHIKDRLSKEPEIAARYDLGAWSVFELKDTPVEQVRTLAFRPALVVSNFSVKQRRRNEYDFVRLAEEQFADGWFDVLLAHSPELRIDRLQDLDQFGALVIETYRCDDEDLAFARLRDFAQRRKLILLSSDSHLFLRIRNAIGSFPFAEIVDRKPEEPGELLRSDTPTFNYESSSIRRTWREIRRILDQYKVAVSAVPLDSITAPNSIKININNTGNASIPLLIETTYHPCWQRNGGGRIYATTPFFMLTFADKPITIIYARRWIDYAGLIISSFALILLVGISMRIRRRGYKFEEM